MWLGNGTKCSRASGGPCTNGEILSQQTFTSVSCTKTASLVIVPSTALQVVRVTQSWFLLFLLGFQNPQILSIHPYFPTCGSFPHHSCILYSTSKDLQYFVLDFFLICCAQWESIFLCVCCRVFCVMPIIPLTSLPYLGKTFWLMSFFTHVSKSEEMPFKPSELWSRQRKQCRVVYGFDWLPACYTTKIVKE